WEAFGFTTFTKLLYSKPKFIERVFRDCGDFSIAVAENIMNLGAETVFIFDDAGLKHSTFLSPKMYERLVVPQLKRICDKVHSYDGKLILHSCGNLYKILDLIIGAGVDALHPWESTAGMDIFKAKEDYGEKLTLIGNVPIDLLTHGTPQQVETYVKKLIKICAPGGGYVLSSGHSIAHSVTLENYEAMLEAARKYGAYPIEVDVV
ncbi:MAG: nucleoside 2-deoxyribosyltransferase, partial [Candidatus Helarchaeota archaeon]|nr:nucleoside 2-deoxyribosyltransferase [Candidatus Helarchaeota archaeon]